MKLFTNDNILIDYGIKYLKLIGLSYVLSGVLQVLQGILKNCGYVGKCTMVSLIVVCLNIALNAIFIYGYFGFPRMEIAAAALATVIANITKNLTICVCIGFGYGGSIIIGNLLGEGKLSEAGKNGNVLCKIAVFLGRLTGAMILLLTLYQFYDNRWYFPSRRRYKIWFKMRCCYDVVFCSSIGIHGSVYIKITGAQGIFCIES